VTQDDFDGPVFASIIDPDSNDFATIAELQALLAEGSVTSAALVTRALARIAALDQQGPQLRAVIETNPDALTIAETLDAERAIGELRGRLHGIPVLIKDNIDSGDSMQTSAGSLALIGEPAPVDAYLVQRLRAAGAVIFGKAKPRGYDFVTAEPLGWSGRGGQTQSAMSKELPVFGSSAGSAVAVSAGFVAVVVGTETNGSLVGPAFFSQVVGLRPTLGLLSASGLVPLTSRQDTAGPMARTVPMRRPCSTRCSALTCRHPRRKGTNRNDRLCGRPGCHGPGWRQAGLPVADPAWHADARGPCVRCPYAKVRTPAQRWYRSTSRSPTCSRRRWRC
jgi:amidase